jgi:hypothetical protein
LSVKTSPGPVCDTDDQTVSALEELFREHSAWRQAASEISPASTSNVYFTHLPGAAWHLEQRAEGSALEPGKVKDPDFVLRFSPGAVQRLKSVEGGIAAFAAELLALSEEAEPDQRVDLRVVASFSRLRERGFLRLLGKAGPKIIAYGLSRGVFSFVDIGKLVRRARATPAYKWEL